MIIFIESNTTGSGKLFFDFCKKEKFKFFFLTKNPKKYDWIKKNNYIECDTSNFNELRKICKKIISKHNIKIIFSTSDLYTSVAYKLSKVLKLNNNNYNFLLTCRNKIKLLKLLKNKGFISRKFGKFKFNNNYIFPIIVKPNSGTGSKNIYKFDNKQQIKNNIFGKLEKKDYYIYEGFLKGQEYSLELLYFNKKLIFDYIIKKKTNKNFVEVKHISSKKIYEKSKKKIYPLIEYLSEVGLDTCFLHIEFKIIRDKIEIIEINPRLCGGNLPSLINYSLKIDLIKNFIKLFKKKNINKNLFKKNFKNIECVIFYIIPKSNKKIKNVKFKRINGICETKIYKDKLINFLKIQNNFEDRIGHIIYKDKKISNINSYYKINY